MNEKKKSNVSLIALTAAILFVCLGVLAFTSGFIAPVDLDKDDTTEENVDMIRNPNNILTRADYTGNLGPTGCGVSIDVSDDGVVTVVGDKVTATGAVKIGNVRLVPGTYAFSFNDCYDFSNYVIKLRTNDESSTLLTPYSYEGIKGYSFTIEDPTDVAIFLYLSKDYQITDSNRTFYPCLVKGEEQQPFYVTKEEAAKIGTVDHETYYLVDITVGGNEDVTLTYTCFDGTDTEMDVVCGSTTSLAVPSRYNEIVLDGVSYTITGDDTISINVTE